MDVKSLRIRREVEDERFEPAVDLSDVVKSKAPSFVLDALSFFERTYLTDHMKELIVMSLMNVLGLRKAVVGGRTYKVDSNLILLPSDLGGGKTHSMILLYHIFKLISEGEREDVVDKIKILSEDIAEFVSENWDALKKLSLKVVVADCKCSDLAPSPIRPVEIAGKKIKTLWGYLGYELGRYDFVREADEREVAPYADVIFKVLNESKALILIDEIGRYYDESGLKATRISAFLMNLAEAMSKYTVREVAVIISIPYEVAGEEAKAKSGMEYIHPPELIRAINEVLSRPNVEIKKPVDKQDLAEILRKRIFEHSREELESLANDFISTKFSEEYPAQVRKVLDERNFWKAVLSTYPFHPAFPEILEKLAYKLPYLQRTRDAIKIAVQTVKAIRDGLFDGLDGKIDLIMPYHIPAFAVEFLDETILRNAPREYKAFQLILSNNVAEPKKLSELGEVKFGEIIARPLRDLRDEDKSLGFKLSAMIWLHSLIGLGLPMNMGDYPTTADLIYVTSPTEFDVKGVLGILRSVLPQLIVHGDPESERARWFFTSIPSVEELVEILHRNVTEGMAKDKLKEFLEWGISGKKGRGRPPKGFKAKSEVFKDNVEVVRSPNDVSSEILDSVNPAMVIFADKITIDDLENLLRSRNNLVALVPVVDRSKDEEKLSPEDVKGIRELATLTGKSTWEGLLEMLRYFIAAESINEESLETFVGEKVAGEEYKALARDMITLLKGKVESKKEYYYRHIWSLINRNYGRVYYHRLGELRYAHGLSLESDAPILPIVEDFLREKGLIPAEFTKDDFVSMIKDYLGGDPSRINIGHVWSFIRTTDKANVPILSYEMFANAVKELIKSLDYAVKLDDRLIWKPIFEDLNKAKKKEEGDIFLKKVLDCLKKLRLSLNDIELIYWKVIFDDWIKDVMGSIPEDRTLKLLDAVGNVLNVSDVLAGFDPENTIKVGKLFYEKRKYIVEIEPEIPEELWEGQKYEGKLTVKVGNFSNEIKVKLKSELTLEPKEFVGYSPLECTFTINAEGAGNYRISVEISGDEDLQEKRVLSLSVLGEWNVREITGNEAENLKDREDVKVLSIETSDFNSAKELIRIARAGNCKISGKLYLNSEKGNVSVKFSSENWIIPQSLMNPFNVLRSFGEIKAEVKLQFAEETDFKEISKFINYFSNLKFRIKEKMAR